MLEGVRRIHMLGIGGIGVSGVARILAARGFEVTGSDVRESSLTEALRAEGLSVVIGHAPENVDGADLVVVSTAIPETNVELIAAKEKGIRQRGSSRYSPPQLTCMTTSDMGSIVNRKESPVRARAWAHMCQRS